MTPVLWPCPRPDGTLGDEFALTLDRARPARLLILPALFDEANRMRRLTVEVMRRLDSAGIDTALPDLPGCNESLEPLAHQTPEDWNRAIDAASTHFRATHVLGVRGGCLFTPPGQTALLYAPVKGASILRQMIRGRMLAAREAGREENREDLVAAALTNGIELAGYPIGTRMFSYLEKSIVPSSATTITQDAIGGAGLWLRAEPDEDHAQAHALAAQVAHAIQGGSAA